MRPPRFKFLLTLLALSLLSSYAVAGKGGSGKPGGDPPPPPPVTYLLQRLPMPEQYAGGTVSVEDLNDHGELVGYFPDRLSQTPRDLPFYYNVADATGTVTNLNDLDYDPLFEVPTGWFIGRAMGINISGDISAVLHLSSDPSQYRGCVIELRPDPLNPALLPRLHLLPDIQWTASFARRINDTGVVLGGVTGDVTWVYRPPLHGQPADGSVQVIPAAVDIWYDDPTLTNPLAGGDTLVKAQLSSMDHLTYNADTGAVDVSPGPVPYPVTAFNDHQDFCGIYSASNKRNSEQGYLFTNSFIALPDFKYTYGINNSGDVFGATSGRNFLLSTAEYGTISINDTVLASDATEQAIWDNASGFRSELSNRTASGFPFLAGTFRRYDTDLNFHYDAFVLIPVAAP